MKKDLPGNVIEDIAIAVVLENESPGHKNWNVYLINLKDYPVKTVLVSSKGYGIKDGKDVKTSVLRHSIGDVDKHAYAFIEVNDRMSKKLPSLPGCAGRQSVT